MSHRHHVASLGNCTQKVCPVPSTGFETIMAEKPHMEYQEGEVQSRQGNPLNTCRNQMWGA